MNPVAERTADWIASVQQPDGSIPWWSGGRTDSWNHTEAAMALDAMGRHDLAARAFRWLAATQRSDGAWPTALHGESVLDPTLDANFAAYVAVGLWHHWLTSGRAELVDELWVTVERAVDFVLDLQSADGSIYWARDAHYRAWPRALLTSSACICLSLDCALSLAELRGVERPEWELALDELGWAVAHRPSAFENKDRFSMDWYYPVLGGAVRGDDARGRLDERWSEFVVEGRGIRCVADRPWVTVAETCELAIALALVGRHDDAESLLDWSRFLRRDDGAYWTGATVPDLTVWPREATTWSAGAVLLATASLSDGSPTAELFARAGTRLRSPSESVVDPL